LLAVTEVYDLGGVFVLSVIYADISDMNWRVLLERLDENGQIEGIRSLTECWKYFDIYVYVTAHALNSPYQPLLEIGSLSHMSSMFTREYTRVVFGIQGLVVRSWED
jgi:hypothetical protein